MIPAERTVEVHFDMKRPGDVSFNLPVRVPSTDAAASALDTLRKVNGINQIKCQPDTYKLQAVIARSKGVAELLAEIMSTLMELMDVGTVHEFAIRANRAQTSMLAEDLLDEALQQLAVREWTSIHTLSLGMARDSRTEIEQRIQTLTVTEQTQSAGWTETERALDDSRAALTSARQSYNDSRHADLNDDGLIALGQVIQGLASDVSGLEKTLEVDLASLVTTRQELAVLVSLLDEAKMKVAEIEKLTCPRYKVITSKGGKSALFTLKARLSEDSGPEGNVDVESGDTRDDATDEGSAEKA